MIFGGISAIGKKTLCVFNEKINSKIRNVWKNIHYHEWLVQDNNPVHSLKCPKDWMIENNMYRLSQLKWRFFYLINFIALLSRVSS